MKNSHIERLYQYDKKKDKGVMFFSVASPADAKIVLDSGINELLVSYHYLRKRKKIFENEILPRIKDNGGLFMTDSGGFSFISSMAQTAEMEESSYWSDYLEEYAQWLLDWKDYIFVAANLDLDNIVGREAVNQWNSEYFEPLEQYMNIVYVAHRDELDIYDDTQGFKRLKEYCKKYQYVGINKKWKENATKAYQIAKTTNTRIHGFAWTSIPMLKSQPHFSVDSSTWAGGARYGTTYYYDGKNFKVIDLKNKFRRKQMTKKYTMNQTGMVDFDSLLKKESNKAIHSLNLNGWKGARREYIRSANTKLKTKPISFYEKNGGSIRRSKD